MKNVNYTFGVTMFLPVGLVEITLCHVKTLESTANMEWTMRSVVTFLKKLKRDEDGASLIEYTVLLAILLIAVITIIAGVGQWIFNTWSNLNGNLPAS